MNAHTRRARGGTPGADQAGIEKTGEHRSRYCTAAPRHAKWAEAMRLARAIARTPRPQKLALIRMWTAEVRRVLEREAKP